MNAMHPVWVFLDKLEGFEFVAFWVAAIVGALLCGFVLDYIMQRQGFGPWLNAAFVGFGVFAGLYLRFNYLMGYQMQVHEPYLSLGAILCVISALLLGVALLRNRFG